jgi:hypothetical protein
MARAMDEENQRLKQQQKAKKVAETVQKLNLICSVWCV